MLSPRKAGALPPPPPHPNQCRYLSPYHRSPREYLFSARTRSPPRLLCCAVLYCTLPYRPYQESEGLSPVSAWGRGGAVHQKKKKKSARIRNSQKFRSRRDVERSFFFLDLISCEMMPDAEIQSQDCEVKEARDKEAWERRALWTC
jgi:hypothetical protein